LSKESIKEQRICVKSSFKVRKTAAKTHSMLLDAYSGALSHTMTYKWFKCFKNEGTSKDDNEWSGWPSA
jgi:hypothetical protein